MQWDQELDLLVCGSGCGGLSAAIFAAKKRLDVVVCEKSAVIGGTTATSGGVVWIPNTRQSKAAGRGDSVEKARTYLRNELGNYYRADLVDAFLESGPKALAELETGTEVQFDLMTWCDYHPDLEGAMESGRSLVVRGYDGRRLGRDFRRIRAPLRRIMVLGGLMVGLDEIDDYRRPWRSARAAIGVARKLARFALDRVPYGRGTAVRGGNALVCRMYETLQRAGVPVLTDTPLVELVKEDGRVVGAVVGRDGKPWRVRTRRGVVLATGGFPHSPDLRRDIAGRFPFAHALAWEGNTGDGLKAAMAAGGAADRDLVSPALWTPASLIKEKDGSETTVIYGYFDRGRPGVIAVDPSGRRFVNESDSYHDIIMAMYRNGYRPGDAYHFVCDRAFVHKHGLGAIRPWPIAPSLAPYIRSGYIQVADTIPALAARIGVDPAGLAASVARHNGFAKTGRDEDFGKGDTIYNRSFGDPAAAPNPCLAPIVEAPFVALKIVPAALGTTAGLKADADAQVLDADGRAIPGLYACGNELASPMRGFYPGGGTTLGPAVTFAYRAVEHAAGSHS